jgi:hypothetical protein
VPIRRAGWITAAIVGVVVGAPIVLLLAVHSIASPHDSCRQPTGTFPVSVVWVIDDNRWQHTDTFDVSPIHHRVRVHADVHGTRNAPIFPDPVAIYATTASLSIQETRVLIEATESPSAAPSTGDQPDVRLVGVGITGVDRTLELAPGRWRLISTGPSTAATIHPCK